MRNLGLRGVRVHKSANILDKLSKLDADATPVAYCMLLRSLLELLVRHYCERNNIPVRDGTNGISLAGLIAKILGKLKTEKHLDERLLSDAYALINNQAGFVSVTSLNRLVHSEWLIPTGETIRSNLSTLTPLLEFLCENSLPTDKK